MEGTQATSPQLEAVEIIPDIALMKLILLVGSVVAVYV
jgi:hypothetical protein